MTYGDVAEYVGAGTGRTVGAVLSRHGHDEVPWHRVIRSTGEPNPAAPVEALRRLVAEGTPLTADGNRVDLAVARWDGAALGGGERQAAGREAAGRQVAVKPPSAP